jgi:Na+-driven multidrug efflux pump
MGRCLLGYLLTVPAGLGVIGIWIGMAVEWFLRALALRIRSKGRLMEKAAPG